jgi:hypothetical protein
MGINTLFDVAILRAAHGVGVTFWRFDACQRFFITDIWRCTFFVSGERVIFAVFDISIFAAE